MAGADRNFGRRSFNSFSGADIRATLGSKEIGELQAISYGIQREKAPIYTMGHKNPRAFSRGKRGIAGTMVFVLFDGDAILEAFGFRNPDPSTVPQFLSSKDEYRPLDEGGSVAVRPGSEDLSNLVDDTSNINFGAGYELASPWYVDQIPPFDVTILAANEYGATISMRIIGAELLNEGYGVSIDDMVSEKQYTYIARAIAPWKKTEVWRMDYQGASSTVVI